MNVVVVIPTYNERENITVLLDRIRKSVGNIDGYTFAYLVADDNSPDGTKNAVNEYQKKHKDVFLLDGKKEGLGKALLRAMTYATGVMKADIIVQMDADLSHDPSPLPQFFRQIKEGKDFVIGTRYIKGGSIPENWGIHRKIYSVLGNTFVRFGLGFPRVHDWTGGYRVFHKKYFLAVKDELIPYSGYVFQMAFLHKAILAGAKIGEVPIHFTDRKYGRSKIASSEYIRNIFTYVFGVRWTSIRHGPFGKFLVVGTIGFIINTAVLEILVKFEGHPAAGSAVGAELAIISNFILNNSWTFRHNKIVRGKTILKFLQFNTTSFGAIIIQGGSVALGTFFFGVSTYRLFYMLGVGIGLIWNYWMYSHVIWKKTS